MRNRNKDSYFFKLLYYILMAFLTINILSHCKIKKATQMRSPYKKEC